MATGGNRAMRILAVLAHPKNSSLCGQLFFSSVEHLRATGATVDVLSLYEHAHEIPFLLLPEAGQTIESALQNVPFYWQNKERFMAADRLLIVYPVWWYAVPGIMKAWLDLITNYAWQHTGKMYGKALHPIKKALIINTAGMSWWQRFLGTKNSATEMVRESCKFIGITQCKAYEIHATQKTTALLMAQRTQRVKALCDWLLKP